MLQRACPVCNGTKQTVIQNIKMNVPEDYHLLAQYDVVACADCGMVYANTAASMEDYDWYYTHCNFYGDDSKDDNSERYDWMEELLEKYLTKDSVMLELGAGNGRYAIALKRNGYARITATDPSGESVERLQKQSFIWGTGFYAMSLLATTALGDCKILGFVDNNRIKQGREMYGHLIYAPEYLLDKHGTAVICSMLYSAQIKKQLEDMHTENEIVIL